MLGRILMLESLAGLSKSSVDHLKKEMISVDVTHDLVEFLRLRAQGNYDLVLMSLDHDEPGARILPELFVAKFKTPIMYYSDRRKPDAKETLIRLGIDTALGSPPTGASIEKFLKTRILGGRQDSFVSVNVQVHLARQLSKGVDAGRFRDVANDALASLPSRDKEPAPRIVLVEQDLGSLVRGKENVFFGFQSRSHEGRAAVKESVARTPDVAKTLATLFAAFFSLPVMEPKEFFEGGVELVAKPRPVDETKAALTLERNMYFVKLEQIGVDRQIDFDAYLRFTKADRFMKYVSKGSIFTFENAAKVHAHGFKGLYLPQDHVANFYASQLAQLPT